MMEKWYYVSEGLYLKCSRKDRLYVIEAYMDYDLKISKNEIEAKGSPIVRKAFSTKEKANEWYRMAKNW